MRENLRQSIREKVMDFWQNRGTVRFRPTRHNLSAPDLLNSIVLRNLRKPPPRGLV